MDLFVLNEEVATLEGRLATLHGEPRLRALVQLAWHLRQRDCGRALALADEADLLLSKPEGAGAGPGLLAARLLLVRAEIKLLFADLAAAQQLTLSAANAFDDMGDAVGQGDARALRASILLRGGLDAEADEHLKMALAHYQRAGDTLRLSILQARRLVYSAFRDPVATAAELERQFPPGLALSAPVMVWVAAARANVAGLTNDFGTSIKGDLEAYQAGLDSGQIRQALVSVTNAAESFSMLGDLDASLEWSEHALQLARRTGWPTSVGVCLNQMGDILRLLARHEEARAYLQESLVLMASEAGSRNHDLVLQNLAQLELDMGHHAAALASFTRLENRVKSHDEPDLLIKAGRGAAHALLHLGRPADASAKAQAALTLARKHGHAEEQIHALHVLAQIHSDHALAPPAGITAPSGALHYLGQALEIAAHISGYTVSAELLKQVASAYAACGDFRAAYEYSLAANVSRNKTRSEEAQKRALAMQIRQEIERAQAETEHHRQLAETMRDMAATLETLGTIGREITASLDANAVFAALHRHVHELLDATFFAIYLMANDPPRLNAAFGIEAGTPLPVNSIALQHPTSNFAHCAREKKEVVINLQPGAASPPLIPGTLATLSLLYSPLMVGQRLLGVMSIQSPRPDAYGERERSIFRALCAYGAIALDNAAAYGAAGAAQQRADQALSDLRQTQDQLIAQNRQLERLSVTDQLTGLYNRLRLDQTLEEERLRHIRFATNFCLLLLDVDEFKSVNDTFGHQTGDQVLVGIARILQEGVREVDVVGRWGGEEFLVICRETGIEGALVLAEKLRQAIHAQVFSQVGKKSASFGVAAYRAGEALTETIARADGALYLAKQDGRNRVRSGEA